MFPIEALIFKLYPPLKAKVITFKGGYNIYLQFFTRIIKCCIFSVIDMLS